MSTPSDIGNGLIFALQDMATALFDSGLPIEYRSAATEDLCQGFGTKAIQLVKEKQMPCPEDQRLLLEAIASGTQEGLPVCPHGERSFFGKESAYRQFIWLTLLETRSQ